MKNERLKKENDPADDTAGGKRGSAAWQTEIHTETGIMRSEEHTSELQSRI